MNIFDAWNSGEISQELASPAGALASNTPLQASLVQDVAAQELQTLGNELLNRPELQETVDKLSGFTAQAARQADYLKRKSDNLMSELSITQEAGKVQNLLNSVPESCVDINAIAGTLSGVIDSAMTAVESAISTLSSLVSDVINQVSGSIDALNGLIDSAQGLIDSIESQILSEEAILSDSLASLDLQSFALGLLSTYVENPCAKSLLQTQVDPALLTIIEDFS